MFPCSIRPNIISKIARDRPQNASGQAEVAFPGHYNPPQRRDIPEAWETDGLRGLKSTDVKETGGNDNGRVQERRGLQDALGGKRLARSDRVQGREDNQQGVQRHKCQRVRDLRILREIKYGDRQGQLLGVWTGANRTDLFEIDLNVHIPPITDRRTKMLEIMAFKDMPVQGDDSKVKQSPLDLNEGV